MQEQLEFQFMWEPEQGEGVKPRDTDRVAEYIPAESGGDLTNEKKADLLEQVLDPENINLALNQVRANRGAPGIDGVTVKELKDFMAIHWSRISQEIHSGNYRPSPVRRVEIPKPAGGTRLLGIPTVIDRVIQQAIQQKLTPVFDPDFSESSYGFRPGRSAHDAIRTARKYMEEGHCIVVDIDLEKFFDRVNHDMLMARVARKVKDRRVLKLVRLYLNSGILTNGVCVATEEGVPQGGPLSPLLSNIMLDDLDKELEKRGHKFCRYADDCNVYVKGRRSGERVKESLTRFLRDKLKLKVNEEKSAVDQPSKRKFLGFSFIRRGSVVKIRISPQSISRLKEKIRIYTDPHWSISMEERMEALNRYLRGWMGYYALIETPSTVKEIQSWLRRRMRLVVWHQWKKPIARYRNLTKLGLTEDLARMIAYSSKGAWRTTRMYHTQFALSNNYWDKAGLINLTFLHESIRRGW